MLKAKKTFFTILIKYLDFTNIFSEKFAMVLPKYTKINKYDIDLKENKLLLYGFIYNLRLVELKTINTYIKTNLNNSFTYFSKSLTSILTISN